MAMNDESLFAKPAADWTDDELRVGLPELGQRIAELHKAEQHQVANRLTEVALELADERDRRAALAREVDAAMITVTDLGILPDDEPADPGRSERLSAAVAEWQAGTAIEAPTKVRCPAGHSTSIRLLTTSAGLLLVGDAPLPTGRGMATRPIRFTTLVDGAGWYDAGCTRCKRAFRLDLPAVRAAVLPRDTMYRAT